MYVIRQSGNPAIRQSGNPAIIFDGYLSSSNGFAATKRPSFTVARIAPQCDPVRMPSFEMTSAACAAVALRGVNNDGPSIPATVKPPSCARKRRRDA
ncbi:hypothetical protein SB444474_2242 [Shigella boydii 4444-74]|uniref:Uncharacterized protein n=1 Tax=Shigella boydii 4444-74 TaxID=766140 RepID=I6E2K7_SHIBO|nr:hypothetical protein SB444474_2242 [Shigella boydii 4444-74]